MRWFNSVILLPPPPPPPLPPPPPPLCMVFTLTYWKQPMFLGYIVLQLFCGYSSWHMYCYFPCYMFCTVTLILFRVCVPCQIWLFSVVPWFCLLQYVAQIFSHHHHLLLLLYAGYLHLYYWNNPGPYRIQCCSYSVVTVHGSYNAILNV
jgi:hypothetical protein